MPSAARIRSLEFTIESDRRRIGKRQDLRQEHAGEPAVRGHVRDPDQLCARTDRAFERGEVELPGRVVVDHVAYTSGFWIESGRSPISAAAVSCAPIPDLPVPATEWGGSTLSGHRPGVDRRLLQFEPHRRQSTAVLVYVRQARALSHGHSQAPR